MRKYQKVIVGIALFSFGLGTGVFIGKGEFSLKGSILPVVGIRGDSEQYKFVKPLLAIDRPKEFVLPEHDAIRENIEKLIRDKISSKLIDNASVYFIDYNKSGTFMINDEEEYAPASLLKMTTMIAYLKLYESNPDILTQEFAYEENIAKYLEEISFEDTTELEIGKFYSANTLIDKMIIDSDNGAMNVLLAHISDAYLSQIYKDLGLEELKSYKLNHNVTIKEYSLFFRVLYNATYLNAQNSEKALTILSQVKFPNGITSALPKNIVVAHKFEQNINGSKESVDSIELHDCGIVYYPQSPYFVCVMTKGKDFKNLSNTIAEISKTIYDFIDERFKK